MITKAVWVVRDYMDGAIEALFDNAIDAHAFARSLTKSVMELHAAEHMPVGDPHASLPLADARR